MISSTDYSHIDFDKINYDKPVKASGYHIAQPTCDDIIITTPKIRCINGIIINDKRSYIEFELNRVDTAIYSFFADLDEHVIMNVYNNSKEWFGEEIPMDVLDEQHKPFIQLKRDNNNIKIRVRVCLTP